MILILQGFGQSLISTKKWRAVYTQAEKGTKKLHCLQTHWHVYSPDVKSLFNVKANIAFITVYITQG